MRIAADVADATLMGAIRKELDPLRGSSGRSVQFEQESFHRGNHRLADRSGRATVK
jgi:hypothetical protein